MNLDARGICFTYPHTQAPVLVTLDFALDPRQLHAVVGPNGCGKSTLMAILAGWLIPQTGTIELDGVPLSRWSHRSRAKRLAYLPQRSTPSYQLSASEVVEAGRFPYRPGLFGVDADGDAAVAAAMHATATTQLAERSFHTLSGGERQRVLLAAVLAQQPQLLLLDEPTESLDLHHKVAVFRLLRAAVDHGQGVAVVTHDLNLAALYADHVTLLHNGRVALSGTPEQVLRQEPLELAYGPEIQVIGHPDGTHAAVLPRGEPSS